MKAKLLALVILGLLVFSPNLLFADCLSLGGYTGWVAEGDRKIIFLSGLQAERGGQTPRLQNLSDLPPAPHPELRVRRG